MNHSFLLSDLVPRAAHDRPDAVAASCDDQQLTWSQLDDRIGRLAAALTGSGVDRGDRVGIYLHKSMESLVAVHGILRAGAAYVPIDPMAPAETVAAIVEDCGIRTVVSHELRRQGVARLCGLVELRAVVGLDPVEPGDHRAEEETGQAEFIGWDEVSALEPAAPVPVLGDDLAYVMYTSGSTGKPKGIMHTHRSGLSYATMSADLYELGPDDRVANFSPLHFDMSTFEILAGVAAAARVVLIPEPYLRLPASLTQYLADQGCTTLYTVPSLFQQLLTRGGLAERDLSAVRWVLPAGEVFPPEPLKELVDLFPNARFSNVYGPAEVNQCTYYHFTAPPADQQPLPIGYRCPDAELLVVDDDDRPVTGSNQGELLVRTATMMAGYWNRPDLDEKGFVHLTGPDGIRQRWYRTGDVVSWDMSGTAEVAATADAGRCLRYHGRRDNQVKIRGNRVELEMVEAAVASLDGVEQAVVGVRIEPGGDSQLVARYVPDRSAGEDAIETDGWRQLLAGRLPVYAIPGLYEQIGTLPLTPSGKVDRRAVRLAIAGPPQPQQ
ncbi:MAG: amino acid adenylation domain-containing protein [Acidimicrobiales bacterium]